VGERWTLLIVRELLTGPKRFKDLTAGLPGISSNLLSARLKSLGEHGIVEQKTLPPPASTEAYALTTLGEELEPVVVALGQWGIQTLGRPAPDDAFHPPWLLLSLEGYFVPERAQDLREVHEYRISDTVFHVRIHDGSIATAQGPGPSPDFVLTTDKHTFLEVVTGAMTWDDAFERGLATLSGSRTSFDRLDELFDLSELEGSF
jgi:DNA-binding HxlR family transcriptional regulator